LWLCPGKALKDQENFREKRSAFRKENKENHSFDNLFSRSPARVLHPAGLQACAGFIPGKVFIDRRIYHPFNKNRIAENIPLKALLCLFQQQHFRNF